eukprot:6413673-Amphidinium_carterae.1
MSDNLKGGLQYFGLQWHLEQPSVQGDKRNMPYLPDFQLLSLATRKATLLLRSLPRLANRLVQRESLQVGLQPTTTRNFEFRSPAP